jgi:hypothetical protein
MQKKKPPISKEEAASYGEFGGVKSVYPPYSDSSVVTSTASRLVALNLITRAPELGMPPLKVRKVVATAAALSKPLRRLCAHCYGRLPRRSRASTRFCSTACRVGAHRAEAHFETPIGCRSQCNATGQKASLVSRPKNKVSAHPHPFAKASLTIFGRGYRWPGAPRLDPELRQRIIEWECGL